MTTTDNPPDNEPYTYGPSWKWNGPKWTGHQGDNFALSGPGQERETEIALIRRYFEARIALGGSERLERRHKWEMIVEFPSILDLVTEGFVRPDFMHTIHEDGLETLFVQMPKPKWMRDPDGKPIIVYDGYEYVEVPRLPMP